MLGAVIGDIIGSVYEGGQSGDRNFQLFDTGATVTDDSVCTIAVAEAVLTDTSVVPLLKKWGKEFINAGYGRDFRNWLSSQSDAPYGSYGNGALMRVSAAIALSSSLEQARERARSVTEVTHDHPVALESVDIYACALWHAIKGAPVGDVIALLERRGVRSHEVATAHRLREFHSRADDTLADVLSCLRAADSFESLMRECVYHGGDTDTICAIAGPLAEALWGLPQGIVDPAWPLIPESMQNILMDQYEALAVTHPEVWGLPEN